MNKDRYYHRGEVYMATLDLRFGPELIGTRPVLLLQNNAGAFFGPVLVAVPLIVTHMERMPKHSTFCLKRDVGCMSKDCVALLNQIHNIDKRSVTKFLGRIPGVQLESISETLENRFGIHISENVEFA